MHITNDLPARCFARRSTIVKDTGFVYCYRCIVGYVRREGRDYVSGVEMAEEGLIRLFVEGG